MILELPFATPSNNVVMRMYHRERSSEHERYTWLICAAVNGWEEKIECYNECDISITRHGARLLDWDNMGGGLKFLMDALVKNKIIKDDNPKCVQELNLRQVHTYTCRPL